MGHDEQYCKLNQSKIKFTHASIRFDSSYMLTKGKKGVIAKYMGTPNESSKKKAIWVPKSLVTNFGGPKQQWVPKKN